MSGGFFRGTTADQDTRFSNKQAKLLKSQKFAPELEHLIDASKVKMDVMKPWIAKRVTELLGGLEDDVLINFIYGLLEGKEINGKAIQIQLTGFLEKNTSKFMKELWALLISAQSNASGVPQQFLDAKEEETKKKKAETDRITDEIKKRKDQEIEQEKKRKMDGGLDDSSDEEPHRRRERRSDAHSGDENGVDIQNGSKGRNRSPRLPYPPDRSPSPHRGRRSRSIGKSYSNSRSYSKERSISKSISPRPRKDSISPEVVRRTPRRSVSPRKVTARESISPRRISRSRRSPSPMRRRFRSPLRRRSPSPFRRRSRSPVRRRSPLRRRRSPSPWRRRSPSPRRRRSPSPIRQRRQRSTSSSRSRSPVQRRSPYSGGRRYSSPTRRRSPPYPNRRRSPSPYKRGSPLPGRRSPPYPNRRRSPSPDKGGSPSPRRRRSPSPVRRRSPYTARRSPVRVRRSPTRSPSRSVSPASRSSASPNRDSSASPIKMKSARPSTAFDGSPGARNRQNDRAEPVPVARRQSMAMSPQRDHSDISRSRKRVPSSSPSLEKSPSYMDSLEQKSKSSVENRRLASPYGSPHKTKRAEEKLTFDGNQSPPSEKGQKLRHSGPPSNNEDIKKSREKEPSEHKSTERDSGRSYSGKKTESLDKPPARLRATVVLGQKDTGKPSLEASRKEVNAAKNPYRDDVPKSDEKKSSLSRDARDTIKPDALVDLRKKQRSHSVSSDSGSDDSEEAKFEVTEKRKRRSSRRKDASDDSSSDSEVEDRKEAMRRKKEERKSRKEERRRRRDERRRRREEKRAGKRKRKSKDADALSSELKKNEKIDKASNGEKSVVGKYSSEEEETESQKKKLEIELREKALESLRAKKGIRH